MLSRFEESSAQLRRALAVDPLSPFINADLGWSFYCARRYDAAIHQLQTTLSIEPNFTPAIAWLGIVLTAVGDYGGAIALVEQETGRSSAARAGDHPTPRRPRPIERSAEAAANRAAAA